MIEKLLTEFNVAGVQNQNTVDIELHTIKKKLNILYVQMWIFVTTQHVKAGVRLNKNVQKPFEAFDLIETRCCFQKNVIDEINRLYHDNESGTPARPSGNNEQ